MRNEHQKYLAKIRQDMEDLPRGSKRWWSLNNQLLHKRNASHFFPPIKDVSGTWCKEAPAKANVFAIAWHAKKKLPPDRHVLPFFFTAPQMTDLNVIRVRATRRELSRLRMDQATGPDLIGALLLRSLAKELALPVAVIARRIFREGWPSVWRVHWLIPLFKKGSVYDPNKYRGVHLSCILSKVVERVVGSPLIAFLQARGYGDAQWAFRKLASARDLVTVSVARWVLSICQRKKIGLYLGDISGAFDKVARNLLLAKLAQLGVAASFLDFLNSYLESRQGFVAVEGALSEVMLLTDMVYQGTVLGPCLWNAFFGDVATYVPEGDEHVQIFADDLKIDCTCSLHSSNDVLLDRLRETQRRAHVWGEYNRVSFGPSKESIRIIHPDDGDDEEFILLGTLFDCKLSMRPCLDQLLKTLRPKVRALVKIKHMYDVSRMLDQFKAHIWSKMEYYNGAILLAGEVQLRKLDKMQRGFLYELGLDDKIAFVNYNLAPPSIRRAIGMLGFLHKRVLGECHPAVKEFFPMRLSTEYRYHSRMLEPFWNDVRGYRVLYDNNIFHTS